MTSVISTLNPPNVISLFSNLVSYISFTWISFPLPKIILFNSDGMIFKLIVNVLKGIILYLIKLHIHSAESQSSFVISSVSESVKSKLNFSLI